MRADRVMPKSLHTVSCMVNVAREFIREGAGTEFALFRAEIALGINKMDDAHGLVKQARAKLAKG